MSVYEKIVSHMFYLQGNDGKLIGCLNVEFLYEKDKDTELETCASNCSTGILAVNHTRASKADTTVLTTNQKIAIAAGTTSAVVTTLGLGLVFMKRDREASLMMFRLSESPDDKARVCKTIDHLTGDEWGEKNILKMMRLGKKCNSTVRSIFIKFNDVGVETLVFKNIQNMESSDKDLASARLTHDLSNDQRIELKKLLNEAKDMEVECKKGFFIPFKRWEAGNNSGRLAMPPEIGLLTMLGSMTLVMKGLLYIFAKISGDVNISFSTTASNLGVLLDSQLSMKDYIKMLFVSCITHLKNLFPFRLLLDRPTMEGLVHVFISTRLDYCNI
ncbi:hypothetical protein HELRODRAFT_184236 [Helobdella robusta]|uniref:Uncharacterized protein n=1 Tax=Helobdella robusta TaxID=6412 RepID=T1FKT7_HELRO|nr:hypothetical protein HELRODRAFT_184236 [Helobdella robusta]ESO04492.1 hypothetical protein HELRODRAFT_184236 [Helobdella robusta]